MTASSFCDRALQRALEQYRGLLAAHADPACIPRSVQGGVVHHVAPSDWTSGFVAGTLWYLFEYTADQSLRAAAERWTDALRDQAHNTATHDVGFMLNSSFGNGLRLTGNGDYSNVLLAGARSLATRFNDMVRAIRSWSWGSWSFPVIVDNMMNLELLYRASALGGDPALADIATTHATTTLRDHFRADASAYHLVDYDPATGAVISKETRQGLTDESAWARGQAWGLYGFTMCHRESGDARFLQQARRIADFLMNDARIPADRIPHFDFDAPITPGVPALRDASAAAIMASALLELERIAPLDAARRYRAHAIEILSTLSTAQYSASVGENGNFILMHSVGDYPRGTEVDAALNYADYYYVEALLRCSRLQ